MQNPGSKYRPFQTVRLEKRQWPDASITHAPRWCSVDLRDGNQALAIPMNVSEKLEMFKMLCDIGFKEIEIGFPSASDTEFAFTRELIEKKLIPNDVSVQVLVQAREHLIRRTIDSLKGARRAIVHLYTPTNPAQREIVFGLSKEKVLEMAVAGTQLVRQLTDALPDTEWQFEFSPETFVLTEAEYALEVCEAVSNAWGATAQRKIILNLPLTVEAGTPNIAGIIGLGAALNYFTHLGTDAIIAYEMRLLDYAITQIKKIPGVRLIGTAQHKAAILSFIMENAHPHDIGSILDQYGVAIRTGHHCAMPLMTHFKIPATARASFAFYTPEAEVDKFCAALVRVQELFHG